MKSAVFLAPIVPVLLLGACGGPAGNDATGMTASGNGTSFAVDTMVTNDVVNAAMPDASMMTAQQFADTMAASDAYEIAAGKLAEARGATADIKQFGARMVKEHTASTEKLKAAGEASAPAITPDAELSAEQQANLDTLENAEGAQFDAAYRNQQVAAHEQALATLQAYAASGGDAQLKQFAQQVAPVVEGHLDSARTL